ncbi:MAG: PilN domain-containing protein [Hydrogenothermaceae bacterium]|nr:PilN domain-containing protein [Hydrogenothermaceae bacterium]
MIKINLNPKKKNKKGLDLSGIKGVELGRLYSGSDAILAIIFIVLLVSPIVYYFIIETEMEKLNEEKLRIFSEINRYKIIQSRVDKVKKEISEKEKLTKVLNEKLKVYENLALYKTNTVRMLSFSINSVPEGLWLESIKLSLDNGNILGYAFNPNLISIYYKNLEKNYDVSVSNMELKLSKTNTTYYFFSFDLKKLGGN